MGMKFSSIVDRHEKKPNESKYQRKRKKIAKRLEFSRRSFYTKQSIYFVEKKKKKKKKKYSWIQIDPFAFPTRTSRGKELAGILVRCRGDHKYVAANYRLISVNENGNERREIEGRIE